MFIGALGIRLILFQWGDYSTARPEERYDCA